MGLSWFNEIRQITIARIGSFNVIVAFNRQDVPDKLKTSLSGMNNLNIFSSMQ